MIMKLSDRFNTDSVACVVDRFKSDPVACVVSLRDLVEFDDIDIPDVQRGLVWNPTQIANLWKSIFAGYPIGALTLYKQGENWQLIDGQQRWHAIKLGLLKPAIETAMTTLWVKKKNPDNLELMVCTRRHPWGFVWKENKLERLPHDEMMKLWKKMMQTDDISFSIPDMKKASAYWEDMGWVPLYRLLAQKRPDSEREVPLWEKTEGWRKRVSADSLPLIRFSLAAQDADTGKNRIHEQNANSLTLETKDADTDKSRIHELFTRINKGGTPISNTDLTYSTLCSYMGSGFKQAINTVAEGFLPPSRVARLYARLKYTEDSHRKRSGLLVEPSHYSYWQSKDKDKNIVAAIDAAKKLLCDACIPASIYLSASGDEWLTVICWCMRKFSKLAGCDKDKKHKKLLCMLPYVVCRDPRYHTHFCERFYEALNAEELKVTNLLELIAIGVAYAACYSAKTGMYPLNKPEKVELKAEYPHNEEWLHIFAEPRNEALLHFLQTPYMNRLLRKECGFYPHEPATWGELMNRPWDDDHIVPQSRWWLLAQEEKLYRESLANKQMLYYRRNREKQDYYIGVPADDAVCPACDFCYPCSVLLVAEYKKTVVEYYGWENVKLFDPRPAKLHASHREVAHKKNYPEVLDGYKALINRRLAEMVNRLWDELGIAELVETINKIPKMEQVPACLKLAVECWGYLEDMLKAMPDAENLKWCAIRHDESRQQEIAVKDFYHSLCSWLAVGKVENGAFRCFCWQQVDARTLKIEAGSRRLPDMTQAEWLKGAEKEGSRSAWWVEDGSFKDGIYVSGEKDPLKTLKKHPLLGKLEFVGELCRSTGLQSRLEAPLFRD
ncbi:MAG: DUF262 domain-containing protein [Akkermansia sp.]|nr:DUF262 domain-containing protein [Akkermansia sp.]